jgi:hypothetical protein
MWLIVHIIIKIEKIWRNSTFKSLCFKSVIVLLKYNDRFYQNNFQLKPYVFI